MKNLFEKWRGKIPNYSEEHKDLFTALSQKFGAEGEKKINLGKHFSTNYELYMFAFFFGLYSDELVPIAIGQKKVNFSHEIENWGSKKTVSVREDFTNLQEYIFVALMAQTNIDLVALEKGELSEEDAVKKLINTMESYTNGGLILLKEKLAENPNYFLQSSSFLNLLIPTYKEVEEMK